MNATEVRLEHPYVDYHHGGYWVAGTRVSLDSLVYRWREGLAAETIQRECYSTLTLAQVFGALAYYLDHQQEVDQYLVEAAEQEKEMAEKIRATYPELHEKMDKIIAAARASKYEDQVSSR